ncbi:hypothetical protein DBR32_03260 [Taibaiella sp. KBW10]|uniref:T9SS type A sorting domain-containing protein n=1 Tax=Taibaiella sp. KBW10 TaxID=2153357 RepID=UPI000F593179|nr:T9SS type A sorting domain-containing protein [Taibaiella sp. KBW10]RQO32624.1 hypothetical protein DBR32_03260 [Taibaiella sp. KBW10]
MKHHYTKGERPMNRFLGGRMSRGKTTLARLFAFLFFALAGANTTYAQDCTANAGGNATVCGSTTTLVGTVSGNLGTLNSPLWTFISGPTTPTIVSPNSLTTNITGMTTDGNYVFRLTRNCGTGTAVSNVTITAHPRPAGFTAGPDITNICATTGSTPLGGVIPAGFNGSWRSVSIYELLRNGVIASTNSQLSSTTVATPTFSLVNTSNHNIDPSYYTILTITSLDGVCSYTDTAIVRFIPNPQINPQNASRCTDLSGRDYINLNPAPLFSNFNSAYAGSTANGTTISLTPISQPAGGALSYGNIDNSFVFLNGVNVPGIYQFTLTVNTAGCGSYTTPTITYTNTGVSVHQVNFQPTGHTAPEQMTLYFASGTGGEVHCNLAGTSTPESFYFSVDPLDPPTVITTVTPSGIIPPGGVPTVVVSGAGTYDRVATVTPPSGGWRIGTYRFSVNTTNASGACGTPQIYYIHVSDQSRPDVSIADVSVCYPGTGAISADINLPAVYKGVVNSSYFQDFNGRYDFTVVSKPVGSGTPTYTVSNLRSITSTSTTISNLTMAGDYVFSVAARNGSSGTSVGNFLEQEYACSGSSLVDTFVVHVENPINPNAGSDQSLTCANSLTLLGNSAGTGTGLWSVVSVPSGSTATIGNTAAANTTVSNINVPGTYAYSWRITSQYGGCTNVDTVSFNVSSVSPANPVTTVTPMPCSGASGNINVTSPVGTGLEYRAVGSLFTSAWQTAPSIDIIAGGTYSVQVRYASSPACAASKTDTVKQNYCGTVVNDANGDKLLSSGESGTNAGGTLYIYAVNPLTGLIDAAFPVAADGTFSISVLGDNAYDLKLSTVVYPVGTNTNTTPVNTNPPSGWVTTGENSTGLAGGDGSPNGSLSLAKLSTGRSGLVFGIERPPVADTKTFNIAQTAFSSTPVSGFPAVAGYKSIPASSASLTGYNGSGGSLSGTDPEDCSSTSACRSLTGTTFTINAINANTKLYYNYGGSTGVVAIDVSSGPVSIPNFDATKLVIYGQGGTGTSGNAIGFDYAIVDKAGVSSPTAPYRIVTTTPLPTKFLLFTANMEGGSVVLNWATAMEQNSKGFDVERSAEGSYWTKIGFVNSKAVNGNSNTRLDYGFADNQPMNGKNIYRLKQFDFDGKFEYSPVAAVMQNGNNKFLIYPNPVSHELIVEGVHENNQARIYNLLGQELSSKAVKMNESKVRMNVTALANGVYYIVVTGEDDKVIFRQRFVKQ